MARQLVLPPMLQMSKSAPSHSKPKVMATYSPPDGQNHPARQRERFEVALQVEARAAEEAWAHFQSQLPRVRA
jgi:hypothetical protein